MAAMTTKEATSLLHTFWQSEIIADKLYSYLATRYKNDNRKQAIIKVGEMERGHADAWNNIAQNAYGISFQFSFFLKFKILLMKLLSFILPFTIFIHYMEHQERNAILDYAKLLEAYKHQENISKTIVTILRHEIGHQWQLMEEITDKRSYIMKIKEAIPGMTAGLIETLGLIVGLIAAQATTLMIGLTGIITMIGGMFAIMSISYVESKGHYDLHTGTAKEINIKKEVHPPALRRELENILLEKGISNEIVKIIMEGIRDDIVIVSNLVKTIRSTGEALLPKETVKINSIFYVIGTLPLLAPFFVGVILNADPVIPAIIAFAIAIMSISITGLFIAVLSGKKISMQILLNVSIIMGACTATYLVGHAARIYFNINLGH
jgi:VIT1/CCC1 family predicted Fe2+/Mn2+ transporter